MGMVFAQHVAHAGGRLLKGLVGGQAGLVHGIENPPVDGLEAVAHIGQGPAHDDRHGVLDVRRLHLVLQVDLYDFLIGKGNIFFLVRLFCQHNHLKLMDN